MNNQTIKQSTSKNSSYSRCVSMHTKKAQTATEYLIILAVVIIIALIVVGVLGGIPGLGGGISEQQARLELQVGDVGIMDYAISPVKGTVTLVNNKQSTIRVDSVSIDGKDCWFIGTNKNPSLTPQIRAGQQAQVTCGSITAELDDTYQYPVNVTYTEIQTGAQFSFDAGLMVGSSASFDCPDGFIPVPGGFVLADGSTVDDFCVMKYEAKAQDITTGDISETGGGDSALTIGDFRVVSVAQGRPWVNINQTNAIAKCQEQGYDLISDQQWMVLAENILNTEINDLNASKSGPQLSNGLSSMSVSAEAVADPDLSECYPQYSLDASENDNCSLRDDAGYNGTDGAWSQSYDPSGDGRSDLRIHMLSNGEVIWDIAGNVRSWTKDILLEPPNSVGYYNQNLNFDNGLWMEPSQKRGIDFGFGRFNTWGGTSRIPLRSAHYGASSESGIFFTNIWGSAAGSSGLVGFRCVYEPN